MKLRVAKKILHNWQADRCQYSAETMARASRKYRPYLKRWCAEKNEGLRAMGETRLFCAPYIMKNVTCLDGKTNGCRKLSLTRYAKAEAINKEHFIEFSNIK